MDAQDFLSLPWRLWIFLITLWHHSIIANLLTEAFRTFPTELPLYAQSPHERSSLLYTQTPPSRDAVPKLDEDVGSSAIITSSKKAKALMSSNPRYPLNMILCHRASHTNHASHSSSSLPSWIPDFSSPDLAAESSRILNRISQFSASGSQPSWHVKIHDHRLLEIHAIRLGTIAALGRDSRTGLIPRIKHWQLLGVGGVREGLRTNGAVPQRYPPTGEPIDEAFWRTVFWDYHAGRNLNQRKNGRGASCSTDVALYKEWWSWVQTAGLHRLDHGPPEDLREVHNQIKVDERESRFARVRIGEGGEGGTVFTMCPLASKVGDSVWILFGASVPFVLRERGFEWVGWKRRKVFRVVGKCYAHGFMNGEGMQGREVEKRSVTIV
ncbi:hypothetical protein QBC42DRAFT_319738 [Cladorrhinum samala]|uniref:Uncharacterized protein n=1 Tax=Cladorrhinum samala TaxID=585594 RepID=A0AAV9HAB8_9PEZI|nr:hypothetical protein QBC42DRAFT_319738 [Cladorrhinum samala]